MNETILKRLSVLLSVKSIVTLVLTGVFAYLAVTGVVGGHRLPHHLPHGNFLLLRVSIPEAAEYPGWRG